MPTGGNRQARESLGIMTSWKPNHSHSYYHSPFCFCLVDVRLSTKRQYTLSMITNFVIF